MTPEEIEAALKAATEQIKEDSEIPEIICSFETSLKMAGLYWRKWPEEKPEVNENVIVKYSSQVGLKPKVIIIEQGSLLSEDFWRQLYDEEILGWMPYSALEVLK